MIAARSDNSENSQSRAQQKQELRRITQTLVASMDAASQISHKTLHSDLLRINSCVADEEADLPLLDTIVAEAKESITALAQQVAAASSAIAAMQMIVN